MPKIIGYIIVITEGTMTNAFSCLCNKKHIPYPAIDKKIQKQNRKKVFII
jgi:hypothetical protein